MRSALSLATLALAGAGSCAPRSPATPIFPAGDHHDDGHGLVARASTSFVTAEPDDEADGAAPAADEPPPFDLSSYGGAAYGGLGYGGLAYGALGYGGDPYAGMPPAWIALTQPQQSYDAEDGLTGAIEGVVTWAGSPPPRTATGCGSTLHLAGDRRIGGALVYIEKVETGRVLPTFARAVGVGGTVVKHGCALLPAAQIVAPLPATLTIHGDATAAKLHVTAATGGAVGIDLQEGGQAQLDALLGVTRIDSDDGKLAPAWVLGVDTPYYAITDDAGRFRIDELAPGTYDVAVWQAPVGKAAASGPIAYGAPVVAHRKVTVGAGPKPARLDVALR